MMEDATMSHIESGIDYRDILVALHFDYILKTTLSVTEIYVPVIVAVTITLNYPTIASVLQSKVNTSSY